MKNIFKPVLVLFLVIVFTVLLIIPVQASWVHIAGTYGYGPHGLPSCYCPSLFYISCGCAFPK
jgi:hypothetical protein